MTDNNQPTNPLPEQDEAVLESWNNVGLPGQPPTTPFVPTNEQRQKFQPIKTPKTVEVSWVFDQGAYEKMQLGHWAQEMEDKWNIYMEDNTVHFHRSWTGKEIFRFTLQQHEGGTYSINQFEVEQNPENYKETNEQTLTNTLHEVLRVVLGVTVSNN